MTYSQFYHFMEGGSGRQQFHPEQMYSSSLQIRTQSPTLPRQNNGTDCGIFTLMYQQTLSNWYGANAGQEFTEARVQDLIHELQEVTPARVREHRTWLRHNMHKWWQGRWVAPAPVYPQGVAQHRSAPEVMMWTNEDSEQVLRQPGLSRDMVGTAAHLKVYRPEGKLLEPEEDSHTPGGP